MINPNKEEEDKTENKENPERTWPSTTKYSSSIGDSGAGNIVRSLEQESKNMYSNS